VTQTAEEHAAVFFQTRVFPNPTTGELTLSYKLQSRTDVEVFLLDQSGKTLGKLVGVNQQHTGEYHVPVDLRQLSQGVYFISFRFGEQLVVKKVIRN
jgi:hypothetical protein